MKSDFKKKETPPKDTEELTGRVEERNQNGEEGSGVKQSVRSVVPESLERRIHVARVSKITKARAASRKAVGRDNATTDGSDNEQQ